MSRSKYLRTVAKRRRRGVYARRAANYKWWS